MKQGTGKPVPFCFLQSAQIAGRWRCQFVANFDPKIFLSVKNNFYRLKYFY